MANFNKVMLIGNLTRDPELRYSASGSPICKMGLATNRRWKDQAGNMQEETCFVDIVVFGRSAENCNEYLRKGRPVFIDGRLSFSSWDDRESGKKRSKLEVVAESVQFLGGRDGAPGGGGGGGGFARRDDNFDAAPRQAAPQRQAAHPAQPQTRAPAPTPAAAPGIDFDDIPF